MYECCLGTRIRNCSIEEFYLAYIRSAVMGMLRNKVCGADIHKKFLVATILSIDGTKISERFGMKLDDILK
jgi:hypothetical protein